MAAFFAVSSYSVFATSADEIGNMAEHTAGHEKGLIGYWPLDIEEGNGIPRFAVDHSGHGNHGNIIGATGSPSYTGGRYGQALRFSGASTWIVVPGKQGLNLRPTNAYTYSLWVWPKSRPDDWSPLIYRSAHQQIALKNDMILLRSGREVPQLLVYGSPIGKEERWYHVGATFDGASQKIYVDGKLVGANLVQGRVGGLSSLRVAGGDTVGFEGLIDDIRIYNRALSAEEILALSRTTPLDNGSLVVPTNSPSLFAEARGANWVRLAWSTPGKTTDLVRLYKNDVLIAEVEGDSTSFEVRHLEADTEYSFRISAVSGQLLEGPVSSALLIKAASLPVKSVRPAAYLRSKAAPVFRQGHTLLPLTKWSWDYSVDLTIEMSRWGYAPDFGEVSPEALARLADPDSREARLVEWTRNTPDAYGLSVNVPRIPKERIPATAYVHDQAGGATDTWSPEAPDAVLAALAQKVDGYLLDLAAQAPLAIVLNGGERFLGVPGHDRAKWKEDPRVVAAKGELDWSEYVSKRKAHQEQFFADAVRAVTDAPYIWYYAGGNQYRAQSESFWYDWDWDYKWMHPVPDYPNNSLYWGEFNTGWVADDKRNDLLSQALNAAGYAMKFGKPLAYNWVCAGWDRPKVADSGLGDIERYYGFLKSLYMVGMIGGVAGYFSYPEGGFDVAFRSDKPPHWLQQIEALAHVHAEFTYLEQFLRDGDLLPGPDTNEKNPDQPAYEFYTGHANTRVLARRLRDLDEWLVSAWAADGVYRRVSVDIPELGRIDLEAYPAGSLYHAKLTGEDRHIKALDLGSTSPSPVRLLETADTAAIMARDHAKLAAQSALQH